MSDEEIKSFPLGEMIRIPTHVVLNRASTTPMDVSRIREEGVYEPGAEFSTCEFVAGGEVIAQGKLVKRSGAWYMQIEEIGEVE